MKLLSRYHSRVFQFAVELIAHLSVERVISGRTADQIARRAGLDYTDQVVIPLCEAGILKKTAAGYEAGIGFFPFALAPGKAELDYLKYILKFPEAEMFLQEKTVQKLERFAGDADVFEPLQFYKPTGEGLPEHPGPEGVRILLQAIRERRLVRYRYRTRESEELLESVTLPWKLEYSSFDRRWWVILYDPVEQRTIKARLGNLHAVELLGKADVSEAEVESAIEYLLAPDPVVLEVERARNALERCFLVFEGQLFLETRQVSDDRYRISFQYYRFDRGEILRRLLYLGSMVTILEPAEMKEELLNLIDQALNL